MLEFYELNKEYLKAQDEKKFEEIKAIYKETYEFKDNLEQEFNSYRNGEKKKYDDSIYENHQITGQIDKFMEFFSP